MSFSTGSTAVSDQYVAWPLNGQMVKLGVGSNSSQLHVVDREVEAV